MKEYAEEPKIGPTETKKAGDLHFDHDMLHKSDEMAPGDRVKLIVHGHVHANTNKDEYGPGHIHIHVHGIESADRPEAKKKNASTMRMDELKAHIEKQTNRMDENMQGHSEDGVKEDGEKE